MSFGVISAIAAIVGLIGGLVLKWQGYQFWKSAIPIFLATATILALISKWF